MRTRSGSRQRCRAGLPPHLQIYLHFWALGGEFTCVSLKWTFPPTPAVKECQSAFVPSIRKALEGERFQQLCGYDLRKRLVQNKPSSLTVKTLL